MEIYKQVNYKNKKYIELGYITSWNKKFKNVKNYGNDTLNIIDISSELAKNINCKNGNIKIITTGKIDYWTTYEKANKLINTGEIITLPTGGEPNIKYFNGSFITSLNLSFKSIDNKKYKTKFIYYFLKKNINQIQPFYRGTTIKHPIMLNILKIKVPILRYKDQKKIIDIIEPKEKIFLKYNKLVNIEDYDEFLKTWKILIDIIKPFESKLNIEKIKIQKINEIYNEITKKNTIKGKFIENSIFFVKGINFSKEMISNNRNDIKFINVSAINEKPNKWIKKKFINLKNVFIGDIILSLDGTPGLVNNFLEGINGYGYNLKSKIHENWKIYYSIISKINQKIIKKNSKGTTILHASKAKNEIVLLDFNENNYLLKKIFLFEILLKKKTKIIKKIINNLIELYIQ